MICKQTLVYWTGKEHDSEGWIYKTQSEMEKETGLSRYWQRKARKILRSHGVKKEDLRGIPGKLWYWVDLEALSRFMETPYSTLNQWARQHGPNDTTKTSDEEYGSSRDSITEHTDEVDTAIPTSEYGNSVPTSSSGRAGCEEACWKACVFYRCSRYPIC
jgi:hypothetical protein